MRHIFITAVLFLLLSQSIDAIAQKRDVATRQDCTSVVGKAEGIYMRIRDARLHAQESIARDQSSLFWDIAEKHSGACLKLRKMVAELNRTGLSRQFAMEILEAQSASASSQLFSGGPSRGSTTSSGGFAPAMSPTEKRSRPLRSSTREWEGVTTGATQHDLDGDTSMGSSSASGTFGSSGTSGTTGASGSSDTFDTPTPEFVDAPPDVPTQPVPRPVDEL